MRPLNTDQKELVPDSSTGTHMHANLSLHDKANINHSKRQCKTHTSTLFPKTMQKVLLKHIAQYIVLGMRQGGFYREIV